MYYLKTCKIVYETCICIGSSNMNGQDANQLQDNGFTQFHQKGSKIGGLDGICDISLKK